MTKATKKSRLDERLLQLGLAESRAKAQALILAGEVLVNETPISKAGTPVKMEDVIRVRTSCRYVSRGGIKLEKALEHFKISVQGKSALDIGQSTGGFTDCLLQHGADHVIGLDVGKNQIHWKLKTDKRVTVVEKVNARNIDLELLPLPIDIIVVDVSFISLELILPELKKVCALDEREKILVSLVKPQFEVGAKFIEKGGIVRNPEARKSAVEKIKNLVQNLGFSDIDCTESPITGFDGNVEFLLKAKWKTE